MPTLVRSSLRQPSRSLGARLKSAWRSFTIGPYALKDPALTKAYEKLFGEGYQSAAGIAITPENALTFSAVFSAVLQISSDVAKLPLNLMKRRPNGRGADQYTDSPLYYLLKKEPNPESTSMVFRRTLIAHALTCHGGYAEIERDKLGRPAALWILTPDRVEPIRQRTDTDGVGPLVYRIDGDDKNIIPAVDMIHIHGLGYDGYVGYEVINKARQAIGLALAAERFGAQYFGKGTVFGGWLETNDDIDEPQKEEIVRSLEAFRSKQDSAWRILVTGMGHKFHQFDSKAKDSQLDESRVRQVEEVARFFRMPPVRLGVNTPGTVSYASVEASDLNYYKGPILDWVTLVEQEFDRKLIARSERRIQFIKHNANAFLRGTMQERQNALGIMRANGIINANEWRDLEDMNPQDGEQGEIYIVQAGQMPLDKLSALADAQIAASAPAQSDPETDPVTPASGADLQEQDAFIKDLQMRLERADGLLATATARTLELEAHIAAALATDGARSEAVTTLESALSAQQAIAAETLALVSGLRADLESALRAKADAEADAIVQKAAAERAAEQSAGEAAQRLANAIAERDRHARDAENALTAATIAESKAAALEHDRASAQTERDLARAEADALQIAAEASDAARSEADRRVAEAEQARADAEQRLVALTAEHDRVKQEQRDAHISIVEKIQASVDAVTIERDGALHKAGTLTETCMALEQQITALEGARVGSETDLRTLRDNLAALQAERDAATRDAETRAQAVAQAEAAKAAAGAIAETERANRAAAEAALAAERQAQRDRLTAVIAAHRGLLVDALGRMTRRECQQARSKQATQEKLRRWLASFHELHAAVCLEAILPAMRAHLAWRQSSDDPVAASEALVRDHIGAFAAQVQRALDADPEEFHPLLDRILTRWESDRATTVADAFMAEEIRHVQQ